MVNRTILVGRLTKNPELRYTGEGTAVASFTIAVNRPFRQNGEQQADFINCVVWRNAAENLATYTSKGSLIGVDGRIQTRSYDGQDSKRVFVTEVVAESVQFLESKNKGSQDENRQSNTNTPNNQQNNSQGAQNSNNSYNGGQVDINDSDLPF